MKSFYIFFLVIFALISCSDTSSEKINKEDYTDGAETLFTKISSEASNKKAPSHM